LNRHSPL